MARKRARKGGKSSTGRKVRLSISADEAHRDQIEDLAERLKRAGMKVTSRHKEIGVISGSIDSDRLERLREVEGVSEVEEEQEFQLPPPGEDLQ
jgi:hypothetical protein